MSKRLIMILAFAFVIGMGLTAYAEVQNVKVSGDITVYGIARNNFDLLKNPVSGTVLTDTTSNASTNYDDKDRYLSEIMKLRTDADLTDNVSATVRLISQRDMNGNNGAAGETNRNVGFLARTAGENNIALHLAYATLKEFLYSPLTLTVGRQALRFGNAWIVGDPDTNGFSAGNLAAGDLSQLKAFDAIRATLDYDPLKVDLIYSKISEARVNRNDDLTLSGLNANYALSKETTLEGFFFSKVTGSDAGAVTNVDSGNATAFANLSSTNNQKTDSVHTVGARVVNKTVNNLTVDASAAFQFGTYNPKYDVNARWISATDKAQTSNRRAWGTEVIAIYNLKDIAAISKYHPVIMGAYTYLSGESRDKVGSKTYHGWDAMFEDQTFGHIINAIMGFSNATIWGLSLQAKPTDDLSAKLDYAALWFNKRFPEGRLVNLSGVSTARTFAMGQQPFAGQELDLTLTYDYTEDVQFSFLGGFFVPSRSINVNRTSAGAIRADRANASELIGSMKVTF